LVAELLVVNGESTSFPLATTHHSPLTTPTHDSKKKVGTWPTLAIRARGCAPSPSTRRRGQRTAGRRVKPVGIGQ
jgi:hypothetical protein